MKTATSLTVMAIGAIFAFAITTSPGFLNLQVVGWILMLTGAAGLLLTGRGQSWLRRRVVIRNAPASSRPARQRPARQRPARQRQPRQLSASPAARPQPAPAAAPQPGDDLTQPIERETIDEYIEQ